MNFDVVYALEVVGFTMLGIALDQTYTRVRAWWAKRKGGHAPPVSTTSYWASMFLLLTLISLAFATSQRIKQHEQISCVVGVIQYNFRLINDRSALQKAVSVAQKHFYRDFYDALVHPVDPHDKKARKVQIRLFTADLKAVVSAQTVIDKARDTRPYETGKNCV